MSKNNSNNKTSKPIAAAMNIYLQDHFAKKMKPDILNLSVSNLKT
jgi:hypothetical protein